MTLSETEVGTRSPCLTLCWETTPSTLLWLFSDTSKLLYFPLTFLFFPSLKTDEHLETNWHVKTEIYHSIAPLSATALGQLISCVFVWTEVVKVSSQSQPWAAARHDRKPHERKEGERESGRERELERGSLLDFIVLLSRRSKKQMLLAIKWWLTQQKGAFLFACLG